MIFITFFSFYPQKYVNRFTFFADWSAKVAISDVYLLHCESVDYVVALATLKAFHGVDCYGVQRWDAISVDCVSYGCNLVAVRHDDAYRLTLVERFFSKMVYLYNRCRNHFCLYIVGLYRS